MHHISDNIAIIHALLDRHHNDMWTYRKPVYSIGGEYGNEPGKRMTAFLYSLPSLADFLTVTRGQTHRGSTQR